MRQKMLPIRLIFLGVMGVFMVMSNDVFGAELGGIHEDISSIMDRLDKIEVRSAHFEKNVDRKLDKLVGIVSKLNTEVGEVKTQVSDVTTQVGEVKTQVSDVTTQVGEVTKQISNVTNQINVVDEKVGKVKSDVKFFSTSVWKFVGKGVEGSHDDAVKKWDTTMIECMELCQTIRMSDGGAWNGVMWYVSDRTSYCVKNDRGHREYSGSLHFRAQ